tara:strand:+ start:1178 stop:1420 length:243 start_codon:yes stop_codon:yes gene_type:complete
VKEIETIKASRRQFFQAGARLVVLGGMSAYATWQAFKAHRLRNDPNCIRLYTCDECVEFASGCKLPKAENFRSQKTDQAG